MNQAYNVRKILAGDVIEARRHSYSNYTDAETGVKCLFKNSKSCQKKIAAAKTQQQTQMAIDETSKSNLPMILGIGGGALVLLFVVAAVVIKKK